MAGKYLQKLDLRLRLCDSRALDHNRRCCDQCRHLRMLKRQEASARAMATKARNNPGWARPAHANPALQRLAHSMVASAKKQGLLPTLDGSIACVDCDKPAREYDHRDYSRPLDVQPVCRSCNKKRGTAKWPSAEQFKFEVCRPVHAATLSSERGRFYVQGEAA